MPNINLGRNSYNKQHITCHTPGTNDTYGVTVGNFTCIAEKCNILLGQGFHFYKTGTIYPFCDIKGLYSNALQQTSNGGDVTIGNDVWIGRNVTIMPGVVIGDGAVIATNSHVVCDIPPYAVFGGNPSMLIKYRFDEPIIKKFLEIQWWNQTDEVINEILPLLQQEPTIDILKEMESCIVSLSETILHQDTRRYEILNAFARHLGRGPDNNGYLHYYHSTLSIQQIEEDIKKSKEYKSIMR